MCRKSLKMSHFACLRTMFENINHCFLKEIGMKKQFIIIKSDNICQNRKWIHNRHLAIFVYFVHFDVKINSDEKRTVVCVVIVKMILESCGLCTFLRYSTYLLRALFHHPSESDQKSLENFLLEMTEKLLTGRN